MNRQSGLGDRVSGLVLAVIDIPPPLRYFADCSKMALAVPGLIDKSPVIEELAGQAQEAFESYLKLQSAGRFVEAG